jgi:hypothetical protein
MFDSETRVFTRDGGVCEIKYLDVGSLVLSRCEKTGRQSYRRVISKFEHQCEETLFISIADKDSEFLDSVRTTAEHRFWVDEVGWVPAEELKVGQRLLVVDPIGRSDPSRAKGQKRVDFINSGQLIPAEVIEIKKESTFDGYDENGEPYYLGRVCNIGVEEFHTYFVGSSGIWVHNEKFVKPLLIKEATTPGNKLKGFVDWIG